MPRHSLLRAAALAAFPQSCWPKPMPSVNSFARELAAESGLAVRDCKKVFVALSDILAREVSHGPPQDTSGGRIGCPTQRVPNLSPRILFADLRGLTRSPPRGPSTCPTWLLCRRRFGRPRPVGRREFLVGWLKSRPSRRQRSSKPACSRGCGTRCWDELLHLSRSRGPRGRVPVRRHSSHGLPGQVPRARLRASLSSVQRGLHLALPL